MKFIFLSIVVIGAISSYSQTYNPNRVNKKAITVYEKALLELRDGNIAGAIPILQNATTIDNNYIDAYLSIAGAYGELKNYKLAIANYEIARNKDTNYFKIYNQPYAINLAGDGKFSEALQAVNTFLAIPNISERGLKTAMYRKKSYEFGVAYQQKHSTNNYVFNPINLGDSVNSPQSEYFPSLSVDDSLLVFTRRGERGGDRKSVV